MKVETLVLGPLQTNCYLVFDEETKKALVIDPADEGQYIIQTLQKLQIEPLAIVATHGHFDHILAATELKLILNIPFLMHKADLFLLNSVEERTKYWTRINADPPLPPDELLEDGDVVNSENVISRTRHNTDSNLNLSVGSPSEFMIHDSKFLFQVIETPGHTPGSICLYDKEENTLFSGDTLFRGNVGRTDFSYGSKRELEESLKKLFKLPPRTVIYPGHGESTILAQEKPIICKIQSPELLD